MILDIIFSLDAVITAIGMADHLPVMIVAIVIAVAVMMLCRPARYPFLSRVIPQSRYSH